MFPGLRWRRGLALALVALMAIACGSLATRRGFYEPITTQVVQHDFDTAVTLLEGARESGKYGEKDRLLYFLDAGFLNHYAQNYEASNEKLELADAAAEELFTKSVSRAIASMALNDNVLEYAGEDYEILYTNLIKAINYISLSQFDAAFVEVRRANLKLDQLENKYGDAFQRMQRSTRERKENSISLDMDLEEVRFHNDAFARWLSMHMYAAEGLYDDARIDHEAMLDAFRTQSHIYSFPPPEVQYRADDGAILSVVGMAGLGPTKEAMTVRLKTDSELDLVWVVGTDTRGNEVNLFGPFAARISDDFYFKFSLPRMQPRPSAIDRIEVTVNGERIGNLQLMEDVNLVAQEVFKAKRTMIIFKSVVRALTKAIVANNRKDKVDEGGLAGWLQKAAIDFTVELTENADIRSAQYLPGRVYVGDFELEPGTYNITIRYLTAEGGVAGVSHYSDVPVRPGAFNLVHAFSPH
ncbi:hypothetical protein GF356_08210 [candidate division GN15 bacterium]|nr:hypothetical protein [candidate division GN15 bacterium]